MSLAVWARAGDADKVQQLLDEGADVEAADPEDDQGKTPLMAAASSYAGSIGRRHTVKLLLAAGADVNASTDFGMTPLMEAANAGDPEVVKELLDAGASWDAVNGCGNTPLHYAAKAHDADSVKQLLAAGAAVDAVEYEGKTPLVMTLYPSYFINTFKIKIEAHVHTMEVLLAAGASAVATSTTGWNALKAATGNGVSTQFLKALYDSQGLSAVAAAVQQAITVMLRRETPIEPYDAKAHAECYERWCGFAAELWQGFVALWLSSTSPTVQALQQLADALRLRLVLDPPRPAEVVSSAAALSDAAAAGDQRAVLQLVCYQHFSAGALQRAAAAAVQGAHLAVSLLLVQHPYSGHGWNVEQCAGVVCGSSISKDNNHTAFISVLVQVWEGTAAVQQQASSAHPAVLIDAALAHRARRGCRK